MQTRRWVNQSQPQTLVIATFLLYFEAVLAFVFRQTSDIGAALVGPNGNVDTADALNTIGILLVVAGGIAAGYFISNERKFAWYLGIAVAAMPIIAVVLIALRFPNASLLDDPIGLMFQVALVALLLHTQSRNYVRVWFK